MTHTHTHTHTQQQVCLALNTGGYFDATAETFIADNFKDGTFEEHDLARPLTRSPDRSRAAPIVVGPLQSHTADHGHAMTTQQAAECGQLIAHTLRAEGHDASEDGTGRGVPLVATTLRSRQSSPGVSMPGRGGEDDANLIVFDERNITSPTNRQACKPGDPVPTMHEKPMAIAFNLHSQNSCAMLGKGESLAALETEIGRYLDSAGLTASQGGTVVAYAIQERAVSENTANGPQGKGRQEEQAFTLEARSHVQAVAKKQGVRRLTPTECARLQGFPDDWLDGLSDSAKYRVLGNAVSVPVAEWIGRRMMLVAGKKR